jgi:hypothetical protein
LFGALVVFGAMGLMVELVLWMGCSSRIGAVEYMVAVGWPKPRLSVLQWAGLMRSFWCAGIARFGALAITAAVIMSEVEDVRVLKAKVQEKENSAEAICIVGSARNGSCLGE